MRFYTRWAIWICTALMLLLQGCAAVSQRDAAAPALTFTDEQRFGERPSIPRPQDILTLSVEQQRAFLAYLHDPLYESIPVHERVSRYLQGFTAGFHYQGDTLPASEAFAINGGNCMSLALMTTALADLAGVETGFQLLDDVPVYEVQGTVVEKGYHVRTILYDPLARIEGASTLFRTLGIQVDYFPTGQQRFVANLDRAAFMAMYYRNIAASAITVNDYDKAYWYLRESLQHAENDAQAINMLAVVSRRTGDAARAEALYRYGMAHSSEKLSLLKNYRLLLTTQGRTEEAGQIQRQLDGMTDPSPFHWIQLARDAFNAGSYDEAIRYYRRALAIAPYMHEAYVGVAQAQYQIGDSHDAIASLEKALENVFRPSTRKLYKAKLHTMKQQEI